jgi:DNA-binding NarL/FixJ family response regulator
MDRRTKVLIVDDEPDLLSNLTEWLELKGYDVTPASSGAQAIALGLQHSFEVVVTDLAMPLVNGHDVLAALKRHDGHVQVIFLTGQGTMQDAIEALREGRAFDFLQKPLRDMGQLSRAIDRAAERRNGLASSAPAAVVAALGERERRLLALLSAGLDNRAIAQQLALSEGTVRNLLSQLYDKLGVANRTQAVLASQRLGLSPR